MLFALVMAGVLVFTLVHVGDEAEWTPLGPFPVQQVKGTLSFASSDKGDNIVYPAVRVTDATVKVTGTKCYREPVTVVGSVGWSSAEPPGLSLTTGDGTGDRDKGCVTNSYVNQIPETVRTWAQARFDEGETFVLVRINGRETAYRDDGTSESVPLTWRTEPFAILPAG